jgi:hypothetical protein
MEQVWSLLQGNLMFLLQTVLGFFRWFQLDSVAKS